MIIGISMLSSAKADTIYVDESGGADYSSIQAAINAANESDTIEVYSGTYNENVIINKMLTINGADAETTSIIGVNSNENTVSITVDNVTFSGFTVDNTIGKQNTFNALFMDGVSNGEITDNILENGENGLYLIGSSDNLISFNTFRDNIRKGILVSYSNSNIIQQNNINNNGEGMRFSSSSSNNVFENVITGNNIGIDFATNSDDNVIYENDFDDNGINAKDSCSNSWSVNGKGNYWDDYNDYDSNNDGIGDTPYEIDNGDNEDTYPLGDFLTLNPVAHIDSISPDTARVGENINFYGHGTPSGSIIDWQWRSTKDGVLHQGSADFSSSSLSVGTHTVKFRVKGFNGEWSDYDTKTLIIHPEGSSQNQVPSATIVTISPTETIQGESIYFHGYGSDNDGMIIGYSWQSNRDGIISSESSFSLSSLSEGTHEISFKVKDNDGEWSDPDVESVVINQNVSMNSDPVAMCNGPFAGKTGAPIIFDASDSYDPDNDSIISYTWDFGDGKSGSGKSITHSYDHAGNFTVILTVEDERDGEATLSCFAEITNQSLSSGNNQDINSEKETDSSSETGFPSIPGFEIIFFMMGLVIFVLFNRKRKL